MEVNNARLREAVGYILKYADSAACRDHDEHTRHYIDQIRKWAQYALAAPRRNCDVGTAGEQTARFAEFCKSHIHSDLPKCAGCPLEDIPDGTGCAQAWAQMPYEEGGAR